MKAEPLAKPTRAGKIDQLAVQIFASEPDMARAGAAMAHAHLSETLASKPSAAVILATGNSQIRFLSELIALGGIDWSRVTLFHMDEYLGLSGEHSASFRRYMRERVESRLKPRVFHYIQGDALLPIEECERYTNLLRAQPIDLCCLGIGENGHLAFNDPPVADFNASRWVNIVQLDHACRMQQVNEGHFPNLDAVPPYAITLTIPALCSARKMICLAPERRKAAAVTRALTGVIDEECPASILRQQAHATLLLDTDSAGSIKL